MVDCSNAHVVHCVEHCLFNKIDDVVNQLNRAEDPPPVEHSERLKKSRRETYDTLFLATVTDNGDAATNK